MCRRLPVEGGADLSAFDEYEGYAHQRVAVAEGGSGWSPEYEGTLAIGFIVSDGAVEPDMVRAKLLEAIRPADVVIQDRRVEHDWGASGPILYDLLIGMGGSMSAAVVIAAVQGLLRHVRRSEDAEGGAVVVGADEVSRKFVEFVASALRGGEPRADLVERRQAHWYVSGTCSRGPVEALLDDTAEIVIARLVLDDQPPLTWPDTI